MLNSKKYLIFLLLTFLLLLTSSTAAESNITLDYEVVVYGGQPEGVFAAVSSARNGLSTILILKRDNPGGLMTYGGLNYLDLNLDKNGEIINRGLFKEWYQKIGKNRSFSPKKAVDLFSKMLAETGVKVIKSAQLTKVDKNKDLIKKITVKDKNNSHYMISGQYFIDGTQDADFAYQAGANFFNFGADINLKKRYMALTLVLNIDNINLTEFKKDIKSNRFGPSYFKNDHAYGFKNIGDLYKPDNNNLRLRGLNVIFNNGSDENKKASINALLIFNHNPLNEKEKHRAYNLAKEESKHVLKFFKKNLKGFENAVLLEPAEELYIRESRHLIAERILKTEDLLENRVFKNTITLASYPLDYQASDPDYKGFVLFNPQLYGIPFDSFLPDNLDNLMVISKSSGMSSLAAASGRVLPTRMNCGASAGKAAQLAYENNLNLKELNENEKLIEEIQDFMEIDISKYMDSRPIIAKDNIYPYLKELINLGLIKGGYKNNFKLGGKINQYEFTQMLLKGMKYRGSPLLYEWVPGSLETLSTLETLDKVNAYKFLLAASSHRVLEIDPNDYVKYLIEDNLIPKGFNESINKNRNLTREEAYYLIGYFLKQKPLPKNLKRLRGVNNE